MLQWENTMLDLQIVQYIVDPWGWTSGILRVPYSIFQDELRVYMTDNPDFVPPGMAKSILTKDEKSLIEK